MKKQLPTDWQDSRNRLEHGLGTMAMSLPSGSVDSLMQYLQELARWNHTHNLTAIRDPLLMVTRHLLDALAATPYLYGEQIADVGSGAGLPGIPLAIACPDLAFTLIESNGKKSAFQRHAVRRLGLKNVEIWNGRVENFAPAGRFDSVISRAFSALPDFVAMSSALIKNEGKLLAMKGKTPQDELDQLPDHCHVEAIHDLQIPGLDAQRCLIALSLPAAFD